jgi:hypothetical protein
MLTRLRPGQSARDLLVGIKEFLVFASFTRKRTALNAVIALLLFEEDDGVGRRQSSGNGGSWLQSSSRYCGRV